MHSYIYLKWLLLSGSISSIRSRDNLDSKSTQTDPNGLLNKVDNAISYRFPSCSSLLLNLKVNLSKVKVMMVHMKVSCATIVYLSSNKAHDNK